MIIYSVDITIEKTIEKKWLVWMQKTHIPDVMKTNLFNNCQILKNLDKQYTYTIKYELNNIEDYSKYEKFFAADLKKEHSVKFKNQFTANRSLFRNIKSFK